MSVKKELVCLKYNGNTTVWLDVEYPFSSHDYSYFFKDSIRVTGKVTLLRKDALYHKVCCKEISLDLLLWKQVHGILF